MSKTDQRPPVPVPRTLKKECSLSSAEHPVFALAGDMTEDRSLKTAAERIAAALQEINPRLRIVERPEAGLLDEGADPLILCGNLADSAAVRELYFRFDCVTDRCYPGTGGYELRTLMDPFGSGGNLIHLGYSDAAGAEKVLARFGEQIGERLPFFQEVSASALPLAPHEADRIKKAGFPKLLWQYIHSDAPAKGYLAYLLDDEELCRDFNKGLAGIIEYGITDGDHRIKDLHIRMHHVINLYRLLEMTGYIEENLRPKFMAFLIDWINSPYQGLERLHEWRFRVPDFPRQNHGLIPSLAVKYLSQYFRRYFPDYPGIDYWEREAERVHEVYFNGSWKSLCDGLCHGWYLAQPAMLEYAFLDEGRRYFESGGARKAAECAMAVINNRGWLPAAGDYNITRSFPGHSLRTAAAYYREPSFRYAHDTAPAYRNLKYHSVISRAFADDIDAERPPESGIRLIGMDPLVYNIQKKHGTVEAENPQRAPEGPIERCFDKLAIRTGWGARDDYLLIDGLGGGSHAYDDAMAVMDYERRGLSLIVQEDCARWPEPENHSLVTIVKDGSIGNIPAFAELIEARKDDGPEGYYYISLLLQKYSGADWRRELWLFPDCCLLVHDYISIREAGLYVIEDIFRGPGTARMEDGCMLQERRSFEGEDVIVQLRGIASAPVSRSLKVLDHPTYYPRPEEEVPEYPEEDRNELWKRRYNLSETVISHYSMRFSGELREGDELSFAHMVQGRWPGEEKLDLRLEGESLRIGSNDFERIVNPANTARSGAAAGTEEEEAAAGTTEDAAADGRGAKVEAEPFITAPGEIIDFAFNRGLFAAASASGELSAYDSNGKMLWAAECEAPLHSVDILSLDEGGGEKTYICAGAGKNGIVCFNAEGEKLWDYTIERDPTPCPWWELPDTSAVKILAVPHAGTPFFAAGCGDLQIRAFSCEGKKLWSFLYQNGVPANLQAVDADGDGKTEILAGGEILSNQSAARILSENGTLVHEFPVEGWTSKLITAAYYQDNDVLYFAFGSTKGRNLRVYRVPRGKLDAAEELYSRRLGGWVTGAVFLKRGGQLQLSTVTTKGFLMLWDLEGRLVLKRLIGGELRTLHKSGDTLITADTGGIVRGFSYDLEQTEERDFGKQPACIRVIDRNIYIASGQYIYI